MSWMNQLCKRILLTMLSLPLKAWFAEIGLKLIDFKLEFGFDKDGKIILADEFSPDNCRLWDADGNHMDKDVFRRGLGELTDVYEIVWEKLQELK